MTTRYFFVPFRGAWSLAEVTRLHNGKWSASYIASDYGDDFEEIPSTWIEIPPSNVPAPPDPPLPPPPKRPAAFLCRRCNIMAPADHACFTEAGKK